MRRAKTLFLIITLIILITFPAVAEQEIPINKGETLTLERCIEIASSRNPNINLANNRTKIYESKIGQVKSAYLPQLNFSTGYNRQNAVTNVGFDKDSNQYSNNIGLSQLLFDFGKTPSKVKIQSLNLNASKSDVDKSLVDIAYVVKRTYYEALSAKISRNIYKQSIEQYEAHLKQAKAFFEAGKKSRIDVTKSQVDLSNSQLDYIKADNIYKTAISSLNNAMGIPDAPEYTIADTLTFKQLELKPVGTVDVSCKSKNKADCNKKINNRVLKSTVIKYDFMDKLFFKKYDITFDEALKAAYNSRPDLKSVLIKENAADESVKLAKKDYFPILSGSLNYNVGGREFPLDPGWSVGANITMPVFNGFLTRHVVNEAKANLDVAKTDVEILRQNIHLEVQQAYINLVEAEKRIPVTELIVRQAKENLDLANGRYGVGVGDSIEVQDAQINYNDAQLSFVQALYDYNLSRINLERAMGVK